MCMKTCPMSQMLRNNTEGGLSLRKFLAHQGEQLQKQELIEDASPSAVLQDHYREEVSEGSGQYDEDAMRKFGTMVRVAPADRAWFENQIGPISEDFASTVYGRVLQDAMAAMIGDPSLAVALYAAPKHPPV